MTNLLATAYDTEAADGLSAVASARTPERGVLSDHVPLIVGIGL